MSDYILKTESNLELLIETRQKEVRENLINQYIKCRKEKNMTQADVAEVLTPDKETVWLTQEQMSMLFDTARSSVAYHIGNIFKEEELDKNTSVEILDRSTNLASRPPSYYNLDVIISVGYRVKSKRGIAFRKWANSVLKDYILKGYAVNNNRINQLNEVIRIMKRTDNQLDSKQVFSFKRVDLYLEMCCCCFFEGEDFCENLMALIPSIGFEDSLRNYCL